MVSGEAAPGDPAVAGGARERARGLRAERGRGQRTAGEGALRAESRSSFSPADGQRAPGAARRAWNQVGARGRLRTALGPVAFVLDAMTEGQRAVAVRAVEVVLRDVAPQNLAEQLAARIGPMSMQGPVEDRGVIRDPLGWLLSQLPTIVLCGSCGTRTTTGSPGARGAVCDRCEESRTARPPGAGTCPGCGEVAVLFPDAGQCGRCDHRQVLDRAADSAAEAATALDPQSPTAASRARRQVLAAAQEAAAFAQRRGAEPLVQDLAARLAAEDAALAWSERARVSSPRAVGAPRASEPVAWHCADARCARRSTSRAPGSGLCSGCERARLHRDARASRVARLAAARA